ncbi:hypothetical protein Tco_1063437 [Tanacetum coccineum]
MQRPPLFKANGFIYWKNRFETYVKSKDIDLWHIIVYGDYKRTFRNTSIGRDETFPHERLTLDESFSSRNHVRRFTRALPPRWRPKSLALKAKKVSSDEEASCLDSEDEEYAMAVRDFKKFFRRRGKFVRQPLDEKRLFEKLRKKRREIDSEDDEDLKKNEICLMAHDSNEYDMNTNRWRMETTLLRRAIDESSVGFVALNDELYVMASHNGAGSIENRRLR